MKLSVMLFPFQGLMANGSLAPATLVDEIVGAGIGAIEPMLSNLEASPEPWQEFLKLSKQAGLVCSCVDVGANLIGTSDADRQAALDTVRRGMELCAELSCPVALIPGTRPAEGMSNEAGRPLYSQGLARCAEIAREFGIIASIEDFGVTPAFSCHSDHVRQIVTEAGPEVKVVWDNGNFILADELPMHAYAALRDLTVHVHIKDFVLDPTGAAGLKTPTGKAYAGAVIGEGDCQVAECVTAFKRDGYDGWLSLEVNAPPVEQMRKGAEFVQRVWDQA